MVAALPDLQGAACLAQPSRDRPYRQGIFCAIKEPKVCRISKIQIYLSVLEMLPNYKAK